MRYGEKIRNIYPKRIYFIGITLAGTALFLYGLLTMLFLLMIPGAIVIGYGMYMLFYHRIEFYERCVVLRKLGSKRELEADLTDRVLWHEQKVMNMTIAAQRKPAVKCTILMKRGATVELDTGFYRNLEEQLRDYCRTNGIPAENHRRNVSDDFNKKLNI